jgi:EamA domain-containing membrane protein RarD
MANQFNKGLVSSFIGSFWWGFIGVIYFLVKNGFNDFQFSEPAPLLLILLAGPMTVIPLFLYIREVELSGLGPSGMIFYVTPSLQFILGFFFCKINKFYLNLDCRNYIYY